MDWQGPSGDRFVGDVDSLARWATDLSDQGSMISARVQHEVDEWEQVDHGYVVDQRFKEIIATVRDLFRNFGIGGSGEGERFHSPHQKLINYMEQCAIVQPGSRLVI